MKILALDLGDQWTGTALSDALGILARPYQTVTTPLLIQFLEKIFKEEKISTIVVGYPKTMQGNESQQTKTIVAMKESLEKQFPEKIWALWDERLTSKQAGSLQSNKGDKQRIHSLAAALILESYLMHVAYKRMCAQEQSEE